MAPQYRDNLPLWKSSWEDHVFPLDDRQQIGGGDSVTNDYIQWYEYHSHPRCQNIEHWKGPQLIATSIGQLDVEVFIRNALKAQMILKTCIDADSSLTHAEVIDRIVLAHVTMGE